jgi:hypothetical protein
MRWIAFPVDEKEFLFRFPRAPAARQVASDEPRLLTAGSGVAFSPKDIDMQITDRRRFRVVPLALVALALWLGSVPRSFAGSFSFTGSFNVDNDVQLFSFTLASPSSVTLETWSYAGGTNAAGMVIPAGGFDPIVSLFSGSGGFIASNDDGVGVATDPTTGKAFDSLLTQSLAAGTYIVALTQFDNFANADPNVGGDGGNLSEGWFEAGNPNFTLAFAEPGSTGFFWDVTPAERTGNWALDIDGVDSAGLIASVPEPSGLVLAGTGGVTLLGFYGFRRRKSATS